MAERAGEAMLNDGERAAGIEEVNNELVGCGNMPDFVETDSIDTGDVEKTGSEKIKEDAIVEELAVETGVIVAERSSGKSEDVESVAPEDEVVSKRCKS